MIFLNAAQLYIIVILFFSINVVCANAVLLSFRVYTAAVQQTFATSNQL